MQCVALHRGAQPSYFSLSLKCFALRFYWKRTEPNRALEGWCKMQTSVYVLFSIARWAFQFFKLLVTFLHSCQYTMKTFLPVFSQQWSPCADPHFLNTSVGVGVICDGRTQLEASATGLAWPGLAWPGMAWHSLLWSPLTVSCHLFCRRCDPFRTADSTQELSPSI